MRSRNLFGLVLVSLGLSFGGCPEPTEVVTDVIDQITDGLIDDIPAVRAIGSTKDDLLVSKLDAPTATATRTVCAIDVGSGVSRDIAFGIASVAGQMVANESYIVWLDQGGAVVQAIERSSGQVGTIFQSTSGVTNVLGLFGDELILHRRDGNVLTGFNWSFRLINLSTTATEVIEGASSYGAYAYNGDYFAYLSDNVVEDPNDPALVANIELIEMQSGARTRIAASVAVRTEPDSLFLDDGQLIWEQNGPSETRQVLAYDLDGAAIRTLRTNFSGDIRDVQDGAFLSVDINGNPLLLETRAIDLGGVDGQSERLITYTFTLSDDQVFEMLPLFVGDTVAWIDPFTGDIITLNPNTGQGARLAP